MTREQAIAAVDKAFRDVPRPQEFMRITCGCEECLERNQTLADHTPAPDRELAGRSWGS